MILVNGKLLDSVPADDRGLAYGDGLFETLRARHGALPLMEAHLDRLFTGLQILGFPSVPREILRRELLTAAGENPDGVVKLIVTRGSGGRGYRPPVATAPRRIVQSMPASPDIDAWRAQGMRLRVCSTVLEGLQTLHGLKHLNRLPQVLARMEWDDAAIDEGLMRDTEGRIVEGTMSNLFLIRGDTLLTPPIAGAGVRGVTRALVMVLAGRLGVSVRERFVTDEEIDTAHGVFMTNSVIGICPVRQIGKQPYAIGTMIRRLQAEMENELERRACSGN